MYFFTSNFKDFKAFYGSSHMGFSTWFLEHLCMASSQASKLKILKTFC